METVTSADGTRIAYARSGKGAPLLLVHGTLWDHDAVWRAVRPSFEGAFTVYAVDRRGRGGSDMSIDHAIEREFEDIASVVEAIGEPVHLLGHSYGALCVLGASLLTSNVRSIVLYEPPAPRHTSPDALSKLKALYEAGDPEGVVTAFLVDICQVPEPMVEIFRAQPWWDDAVRIAHTVPTEARGVSAFTFDASRFRELSVPALLLVGGASGAFIREI